MKGRFSKQAKPHEDYGFFGPDSPTWKVWNAPTAVLVGFQRSVVVEELDPFLLAAVNARRGIYTNPKLRYDRTIRYFATIAVGDCRSAIQASELLVRVHSKAVGIEPVSGRRFDANDPDSQLWIHMTGWHSVLKAYEVYGPGKLSPEDEARYWSECAIAAELQTCDPAKVPRTRDGVRQYFAEMRPRLAVTEVTRSTMRYLLDGSHVLLDEHTPRALRPAYKAVGFALGAATLATLPRHLCELAGLRKPRLAQALIKPAMRLAMRVFANRHAGLWLIDTITPSTRPVVEPVLRGMAPARAETLSPAEARRRYGTLPPETLHRRLREAAA